MNICVIPDRGGSKRISKINTGVVKLILPFHLTMFEIFLAIITDSLPKPSEVK